jgi:hypothetical protein
MTEYLLGKIEDFPEGKGRAFQAGTRTSKFRVVSAYIYCSENPS